MAPGIESVMLKNRMPLNTIKPAPNRKGNFAKKKRKTNERGHIAEKILKAKRRTYEGITSR